MAGILDGRRGEIKGQTVDTVLDLCNEAIVSRELQLPVRRKGRGKPHRLLIADRFG